MLKFSMGSYTGVESILILKRFRIPECSKTTVLGHYGPRVKLTIIMLQLHSYGAQVSF